MDKSPIIVWFRRDLRMTDHPALAAAAAAGTAVIPLYLEDGGGRPPGAASRWWLHHSLASLTATLDGAGSPLVLRRGPALAALLDVAARSGARRVYFNRSFEPGERGLEERLARDLEGQLELRGFAGDALHTPGTVLSAAGTPLRVFTPFWRACLARPEPPAPLPAPAQLTAFTGDLGSEPLAAWRLRPARPDWAAGWKELWQPGEAAAAGAVDDFIDGALAAYATARDRPDRRGTSRLSPHLHFGEVSPRQVWHAVRSRAAGASALATGADSFLRELGWREFSLHLLHHWPELPTTPFQPAFAAFPWRRDPARLRAWQRGATGYPLVDAGLRELWATGWMHNRVRMVAASFLVKHLQCHWQDGEAWFWDTLVDADLANNVGGWQWVAGCGADAAPWFRIFNPALQGARFDPDGAYVRRWVPELAALPLRYLHAPWSAPAGVLHAAGIVLGRDYPAPLVEHGAARQAALAAYAKLRDVRR